MFNLVDYRDPIVGVITIFIFIFATSFITYTIGKYKEKQARKEYRKLLKRFELGTLKEDDYIHLYSTYNLPFDSIVLLASSFVHKGQYSKAISVYLALLEHVQEPVKKQELLEYLGDIYYRSGLLQRSKDIFLQLVKQTPRNKFALHKLLLIFQSLNEYEKAQEVLEALEELDEDIQKEKLYLQSLQISFDPLLSYEKKSDKLLKLLNQEPMIARIVVQFLVQYNKIAFWENIEKFDILNIIDILWYLDFDDINWDIVSNSQILSQIYSAKGYINSAKQSEIFELHTLISVRNSPIKSDLDLNFEFICTKCKKTHPIYESRCPHCEEILTFDVEPKLGKPTLNLASLL